MLIIDEKKIDDNVNDEEIKKGRLYNNMRMIRE
jgi:hypothetical protein